MGVYKEKSAIFQHKMTLPWVITIECTEGVSRFFWKQKWQTPLFLFSSPRRSLKPWGREWLNLTTHSKLLQSSNKRVTGAECFTIATHLTLGFEKFSQVAFSKSSTELTNLFSSHQYTTITSNTVQIFENNILKWKKKDKEKWSWVFPFFWTEGTLY